MLIASDKTAADINLCFTGCFPDITDKILICAYKSAISDNEEMITV